MSTVKVVPGTEFPNGMTYSFFWENFCARCKNHKDGDDMLITAPVEQGGCPIENAIEDAACGGDFPYEDVVSIEVDGRTKYWHVCRGFDTDDAGVKGAYLALFEGVRGE